MKKNLLKLIAVSAVSIMLLGGCGSSSDNSESHNLKVGMVTGTGTIDDKSFNQGTWEGLLQAKDELKLSEPKYLQPNGETKSDYLKEIGNLVDGGYNFIAAPGFKLEQAIYDAQDKYPDVKFLLIDGVPTNENEDSKINDNTISVMFAEEQAGFIVGVTAALEVKEGKVGFIGGMKIPAVIKFANGYVQGVDYANQYLNTNVSLNDEDLIYQGTFDDVAAGQQIAAQMYDRNVKVIFACAGSVGNGVINEAKNRVNAGEEVWVIGVDRDQYEDGIYADGKSVILTSAVKKLDSASYNVVKDIYNNEFKGGESIIYDITKDAIGLPEENPNLNDETLSKVNEIVQQMKDGKIVVSSENTKFEVK
ncbi:MAG: BMP family protein [Clostridium sp.]